MNHEVSSTHISKIVFMDHKWHISPMIPEGMTKAATGQRIELLRKALGYSNATAFAALVGFSASQLKNYESGLQYPRMDQLDKLQRTTLAGLDYILRGDLSSTPFELASRIRDVADGTAQHATRLSR